MVENNYVFDYIIFCKVDCGLGIWFELCCKFFVCKCYFIYKVVLFEIYLV